MAKHEDPSAILIRFGISIKAEKFMTHQNFFDFALSPLYVSMYVLYVSQSACLFAFSLSLSFYLSTRVSLSRCPSSSLYALASLVSLLCLSLSLCASVSLPLCPVPLFLCTV